MHDQLRVWYGRDRFDRFGDDLCELVLSYLSINDCFRYECVAKQWQTVIFNSRKKLILNDHYCAKSMHTLAVVNESTLEYALRKCRHITAIIVQEFFDLNDTIIDTISSSCRHLKLFVVKSELMDVSEECLTRFAMRCPSLQSIYLRDISDHKMTAVLRLTPNIKSVGVKNPIRCNEKYDTDSGIKVLIGCQQLLRRLEETSFEILIDNDFVLFADHYCKQLKKISVRFVESEVERENTFDVVKHLARFETLETLKINFRRTKGDYISDLIQTIGSSCKQLVKLQMRGITVPNVFHNFRHGFPALKKLRLEILEVSDDCGGLDGLKYCPRLTHLSLYRYKITEEHLNDIHLHLPQLCSIHISSGNTIRDRILRRLAKMPNLRTVRIGMCTQKCLISDHGVRHLILKCVAIRHIELHCKTNVNKVEIDRFIRDTNRKINFVVE